MIIAEKSQRKEEVVLLRAFNDWKRFDYAKMLEGLKLYSASLDSQKYWTKRSLKREPTPNLEQKH